MCDDLAGVRLQCRHKGPSQTCGFQPMRATALVGWKGVYPTRVGNCSRENPHRKRRDCTQLCQVQAVMPVMPRPLIELSRFCLRDDPAKIVISERVDNNLQILPISQLHYLCHYSFRPFESICCIHPPDIAVCHLFENLQLFICQGEIGWIDAPHRLAAYLSGRSQTNF